MKHILIFDPKEMGDRTIAYYWGFFVGQAFSTKEKSIKSLLEKIGNLIGEEMIKRGMTTKDELDMQLLGYQTMMKKREEEIEVMSKQMLHQVTNLNTDDSANGIHSN